MAGGRLSLAMACLATLLAVAAAAAGTTDQSQPMSMRRTRHAVARASEKAAELGRFAPILPTRMFDSETLARSLARQRLGREPADEEVAEVAMDVHGVAAGSVLWFGIQVIDEATGRGVPCVQLSTTAKAALHTDSAGWAAFYDPGLMNDLVWWTVSTDGYQFPADGLGSVGFRALATPGGFVQVKIQRLNIAERLYRFTGEGIYLDSWILGKTIPAGVPLLNSQVTGQDSTQVAVHDGKLFLFWGDTNQVNYPLGNFHSTGAWANLPASGGLPASDGVALTYFNNSQGFVKPITNITGNGLDWIFNIVELPSGQMMAHYTRIAKSGNPDMWGPLLWNDELNVFEETGVFNLPTDGWQLNAVNGGQATVKDGFVYFATPFPFVRAPATVQGMSDPTLWQYYSPLVAGTLLNGTHTQMDRNSTGALQYGWKNNTQPVLQNDQKTLIFLFKMAWSEAAIKLQDTQQQSCYEVILFRGSVNWNTYLNKYIMLATENAAKASFDGEVWFAASDKLEGPWMHATKVITHNVTTLDLYNPLQYPPFDEAGGRVVYLSGTLSDTYVSAPPIPRYDYNNMMYSLDLASIPPVVSSQNACWW